MYLQCYLQGMGRVCTTQSYHCTGIRPTSGHKRLRGGCHFTTHGYNKGPGKFVTYHVSVTGSWLCFANDICLHSSKASCVRS